MKLSDQSRRFFLKTATLIGAGALLQPTDTIAGTVGNPVKSGAAAQAGPRPVSIASANGLEATRKAVELIRGGADTLDAAIAGVNIVENDPQDDSVGYGGLPNEEGLV